MLTFKDLKVGDTFRFKEPLSGEARTSDREWIKISHSHAASRFHWKCASKGEQHYWPIGQPHGIMVGGIDTDISEVQVRHIRCKD